MILNITPVPKPRMTRADRWKKRPIVLSYWTFKNELVLKANKAGLELGDELNVIFVMPFPESWSEKKKKSLEGMPHQQRPDLDNLCKAAQDCLLKEDSHIHKIVASKIWGREGKIIFI